MQDEDKIELNGMKVFPLNHKKFVRNLSVWNKYTIFAACF